MVNRAFPRTHERMNPILSGSVVHWAWTGAAMPVQRKVFRIEEGARLRSANGVAAQDADGALRHREFMTEMQSLRELIGPRTEVDRDALERARAQIAEAQAYKHELGL